MPAYRAFLAEQGVDAFVGSRCYLEAARVLGVHRAVVSASANTPEILEQLEGETKGRVEFARLNIDENPLTAARYDVLSIPTAILFDGGVPKATVIGARPRSHYERALAEVLPAA